MDYLLSLSKNSTTRQLVRSLGLPTPVALSRSRGAYQDRILNNGLAVVGAAAAPELLSELAETLPSSGARVALSGAAVFAESRFRSAGAAWAEPLVPDEPSLRPQALIFDATGLRETAELSQLYEFFSPRVRNLERHGRLLVLARPPDGKDPRTDAARQAVEGFVRSAAKELGRKAVTANLVWVESGAEAWLRPCVRFFLSTYSAFVTAQPLTLTARASGTTPPVSGAYQTLRGKLAVVTGAAQGIGAATAGCLAREGAHVVVLDRPGTESQASRVAKAIGGSTLLLDVSQEDAGARLSAHIRERQAGVDIIVHNAGLTRDRTLGRMRSEEWDSVLNVNLDGALQMTEALLSAEQIRSGGRIIALSSVGGIAGNVGQTNYAASKAGLIGYVRAQSRKLQGQGVCVNAVAPGFIETRMTARMPVLIREAARRLSALNQGGAPEDVAEVVTFLATPLSQGITGNVLRVCGGALIGA